MKTSIQTKARISGLIYLVIIAGGIFAELFVRGGLVVNNNPSATAHNILSHQFLYRTGFAVELFYCLINVPLILLFYKIFKIVNKNLTLLVVCFSLIGTAIESVCLLFHFAPLIFLTSPSLSIAQAEALTYLSLRFFGYGFSIALVFFGAYCLSMGMLIYQSAFLPKFIGVLLFIQGVCYLVNSFGNFLAPAFAAKFFSILEVSGLGEVSFCLWLLTMGVNTIKWQEKTIAEV